MSVTFRLPIPVRFPSDPSFTRQIPWFLSLYISSIFYCANNVCGLVSLDFLCFVTK